MAKPTPPPPPVSGLNLENSSELAIFANNLMNLSNSANPTESAEQLAVLLHKYNQEQHEQQKIQQKQQQQQQQQRQQQRQSSGRNDAIEIELGENLKKKHSL